MVLTAVLNVILWIGVSFAVLRPYGAPIHYTILLGILLGVIYTVADVGRHLRMEEIRADREEDNVSVAKSE